jgi:hypothetical protein
VDPFLKCIVAAASKELLKFCERAKDGLVIFYSTEY